MEFYLHFILDMDRSPGFGSNTCNFRAIHTRFPFGSVTESLNLLHTLTRRTVLQKVPHRALNPLCVLVNTRFQVLFHSPPGVLFTFPSQYCSTIGHWVVFRLGGWSPRFQCGFHVPAPTPDTAGLLNFSVTRLSLSTVELPISFS